ncbi:MAG: T9SS type A sorting domain-containing protein, partial [Bacteroidota bacterium]
QAPFVDIPGTYSLLVRSEAGCEVTETISVVANPYNPVVNIPETLTLDCLSGEVMIAVTASNYDSFSWQGPNGFTASQLSPTVSVPGTYTINFQRQNECAASYHVNVLAPASYSPTVNVPTEIMISCEENAVTIPAVIDSYDAISWEGPNNFSSNELNPSVDQAGTYTLKARLGAQCMTPVEIDVIPCNENISFSSLSEVEDIPENGVFLAPNRTSSLTNLHVYGEQNGMIIVEIFSTIGSKVFEAQLEKTATKHVFSLSLPQIAEGMYWVQVQYDQQVFSSRLLLEN